MVELGTIRLTRESGVHGTPERRESGFNAVLGGNRSIDGKYDRLEAHGIYWTASENNPITAPLYNFGKGGQGLYRGPQGQKQMAVSVRCVRE